MPAAGVHPVQRWRGELGAGFGWLPGDQGAVAAAGAADVDDGPVRLAYHAVPGFGDAEERYPGIAAHLRACGPCGEDLEGLLAAVRGEKH